MDEAPPLLDPAQREAMVEEVPTEPAAENAVALMAGKVRDRILVKI